MILSDLQLVFFFFFFYLKMKKNTSLTFSIIKSGHFSFLEDIIALIDILSLSVSLTFLLTFLSSGFCLEFNICFFKSLKSRTAFKSWSFFWWIMNLIFFNLIIRLYHYVVRALMYKWTCNVLYPRSFIQLFSINTSKKNIIKQFIYNIIGINQKLNVDNTILKFLCKRSN